MSHTIEQQKWLDMREYERQGKSHLCQAFKNCAVTMAGELVIGLTKSTKFWHYSARYLERDGKRLTGQVFRHYNNRQHKDKKQHDKNWD